MAQKEIMTCEQYVLNRLTQVEEENKGLRAELNDLELYVREMDKVRVKQLRLLHELAKRIRVELKNDGTFRYLYVDDMYVSLTSADSDELNVFVELQEDYGNIVEREEE